ncbi:MAG: hypothetical protein ACRDHU_07700 [Actinomycetota bacterium]
MQAQPTAVVPRGIVVGVGLGLTAAYVLAFVLLMNRTDYDTWGAAAIVPILLVVTLPALAKQAERENDRRLFWLLCLALAVKLAATLIRYYVVFDVYGGRADARGYDGGGTKIAESFLQGDFSTQLEDFSGTNFIVLLTGVFYTLTRPTLLGGFFVFSWLAFVGMFLFYRAFVMAVPEGRSRTYARLLFFLPSMLFWPGSIGKEAFMVFALGVAAFGVAHVVTGRTVKGLVLVVLSLWPAAVVRPHIAGMLAIALVVAFLIQPMRNRDRPLAVVFRGLTLVVLVAVSIFLVRETQQFLRAESIAEALSQTSDQTGKGGSEFTPVNFFTPLGAPIATFTVLYRPTLADAHNVQAVLAGLEGSFLLLFTLFRWRWVVAAFRSLRRQPYVAFAVAYVGMLVIGLSSFANFALLARERVQLLPLFFVLLSIPPRPREAPDAVPPRPERVLVATRSGSG